MSPTWRPGQGEPSAQGLFWVTTDFLAKTLIREVSVVVFVTCSLWAEAGIVGVWEVMRRREPASSALFLGVPPATHKAQDRLARCPRCRAGDLRQ